MKTTNNYLIYIQDALDAFGLSDKTRKYGGDHSGYDTRMLYEIQDTIESLPPAQPERAVKDCRNCGYGGYNDHYCTYFCYCADECKDWDKWKPSSQPEKRLKRISDLVEGSIDHFDRDDAMNLLYQIKAALK